MERKFGLYIVWGMLIGAMFGVLFGPALENPFLGIGLGAMGGVFLGWFAAAAALRDREK